MAREARASESPDAGPIGASVGVRAQIACLAELAAPNPGNVRPGHNLPDLTAGDMTRSAAALGPAMAAAGRVGLGRSILRAVRDTRRWVDTNTNLGIILLLAPPARAAALALADRDGSSPADAAPSSGEARPDPGDGASREPRPDGVRLADDVLWERLEGVLASTTVEDAELAYRGIRRAEPGGLGRVEEQDVRGRPTVPLRDAMARAAGRDAVAEQYATGYELVRARGLPAVRAARRDGLSWEDAGHRCFVRLLAERPDSLVERKFGAEEARDLREEAERLLALGPPDAPGPAVAWAELDRKLRSASPPRNPGTTADLTAASLFLTLLLDVGWNSPEEAP